MPGFSRLTDKRFEAGTPSEVLLAVAWVLSLQHMYIEICHDHGNSILPVRQYNSAIRISGYIARACENVPKRKPHRQILREAPRSAAACQPGRMATTCILIECG